MSVVTATARVRVTIEVSAGGAWGGGCMVEQVEQQARESAVNCVKRHMSAVNFKIVGEPTVEAIITRRE